MYLLRRKTTLIKPFNFIHLYNYIFRVKDLYFFYYRSLITRLKPSTPSATKKEVSFKPETELGYVTSNCMERAVRHEKRS